MLGLGSPSHPFAELGTARAGLERGLGRRLVLTVPLLLAPRRLDESDTDRVLVAGSLLSVGGDLLLIRGGEALLVGTLAWLGPALPVAQGDAPARAELRLGLDLDATLAGALAEALAAGGLLHLRLRGLVERWENPLYDEDGYQRMRVGDSGLSRALQAMGQRAHLPLEADELPVTLSAAEREALIDGLRG